jgi:hypothetical protein
VRSVEHFRDRQSANAALWSVTLEDTELEALLPSTHLYIPSRTLVWG